NQKVDNFEVDPCKFAVFFNPNDCTQQPGNLNQQRIAVDGSMKTPGLRNVGQTPPYFHNGGQANLHQVIAFYNRGGDRVNFNQDPNIDNDSTGTGALGNPSGNNPQPGVGSNLDPDIELRNLSLAQQNLLRKFLLSLTDQRVACHSGVFDHPSMTISAGVKGPQPYKDSSPADNKADEDIRTIPAVGQGGLPVCAPN